MITTSNLPVQKVILNRSPREYKRQPTTTYCGAFTIDAFVQAFGLQEETDPKDYLPWYGRISGKTTHWTLKKVLEQHGLKASIHYGSGLKKEQLIDRIKKEIDKGNPTAVVVNRSYDCSDSKKATHLIGHWISVWGYDEEGVFIYDSCADPNIDLPIGNLKLDWGKFVNAWRGAIFFRNWFIYCPVSGLKEK